MKRPLQLSLAIALALGGTNALALGLGPVHVRSKLNQPLDAEIPVIQGSQAEAEGLIVNMAGAEDFERVGLNRSRISVPLEFAVVKGSRGDLVIKVTSKEPVRESYLDFLVEANWPKGRLLREYTVLLDPPLMAPATTRAATTAAVAPSPGTVTLTHREKPSRAAPAVARTPRAEPAPRVAAKPERAAPARKAGAEEYGPVEGGETLSAIARATRPDDGANVNQMMLALLRNNPHAFFKDNINALKRGAILRMPSAEEIRAVGSASAAAALVHAQIEDWRGGRASPTLVADAGSAKPSTTATESPKLPKTTTTLAKTPSADRSGNERLELVPPKSGKDSVAMADRPGSGAGSPAATTELKSELARTKEALTTREQETGELKSRVKELEDLKNKNDRLIGLKDSEIAELQQKLKQLQKDTAAANAKPSAPAATIVATPPTAPTAPTGKPATPSMPVPPVVSPPPPKGSMASAPGATSATATSAQKPGASTSASEAKIDKQDIWGDTGSDIAKSAQTVKPTAAPAPVPGAAAPAAGVAPGAATTIPLGATPATSDATHREPAPVAKPIAGTPVAAAPGKSRIQPTVPAELWYDRAWVKTAALVAGILLLLAGLFGMRRRNVAPVARGSIADAFGDSPLAASGDAVPGSIEAEEADLREQLRHDPANIGLHLELLSVYYAERDVARFEDAVADMHAYVTDPHQPEWLEAQAMGQELAPGNPLFSGGAHFDDTDAMTAAAHADTVERPVFAETDDDYTPPPHVSSQVVPEPAHLDSDPGFDAEPAAAAYAAPAMPAPAPPMHDSGFDFDDLPPLEPVKAATAARADLDDEYFAGDDAIGTKLDLAKAYMDMGDPEGARSMLEEVVAEGSDAQKAEAHRLIAELR
jgi:pilus assembly protein FimV